MANRHDATYQRGLQGDELKNRATGALPAMKRANERADSDRGKILPLIDDH